MSRFKLTYFDFDGGRGEPIRIAFHAAGVEFEDHRISFDEFMKNRGDMRFTCAPELEIDGVTVTQSNSNSRVPGKAAVAVDRPTSCVPKVPHSFASWDRRMPVNPDCTPD